MVNEQRHHEELIAGISKQMKSILASSQKAVYIYLDDIHKVFNGKYASLLGYQSPEEWAKLEYPMNATVERSSQETLVNAFNGHCR